MASESKKPKESWSSSISKKGEFLRRDSNFRNFITANGSSGFPAQSGRYHLYVSLACPWAHRTLIMRMLKGLEDVISYTVVHWFMGEAGWTFTDQEEHCSLDTVNQCSTMREVYALADPAYAGAITVPVLWDKENKTIVNNESSEIIRVLNTEFNAFCATDELRELDFYPESLHTEIDEINSWVYPTVNNGVYRCGFARTQDMYDVAVKELFESLEKLEALLSNRRFLTGPRFTEADIRLFTTLVRFDLVYVGHFKCNKKRIVDYPNLWGYTRDIYQLPGVAPTVSRFHITYHYQSSHKSINPYGIVSIGPDLDFNQPHDRHLLS